MPIGPHKLTLASCANLCIEAIKIIGVIPSVNIGCWLGMGALSFNLVGTDGISACGEKYFVPRFEDSLSNWANSI
jgi:hypothetical protein